MDCRPGGWRQVHKTQRQMTRQQISAIIQSKFAYNMFCSCDEYSDWVAEAQVEEAIYACTLL